MSSKTKKSRYSPTIEKRKSIWSSWLSSKKEITKGANKSKINKKRQRIKRKNSRASGNKSDATRYTKIFSDKFETFLTILDPMSLMSSQECPFFRDTKLWRKRSASWLISTRKSDLRNKTARNRYSRWKNWRNKNCFSIMLA